MLTQLYFPIPYPLGFLFHSGVSDWDNGGGKRYREGEKLIKLDSSEAAEWEGRKVVYKGPRTTERGK